VHPWCAAGSWHVAMLTRVFAIRYSLLALGYSQAHLIRNS
jgi:hypothetical protein